MNWTSVWPDTKSNLTSTLCSNRPGNCDSRHGRVYGPSTDAGYSKAAQCRHSLKFENPFSNLQRGHQKPTVIMAVSILRELEVILEGYTKGIYAYLCT